MRNLKRALSLVLATVMVIGMMVVGASAASYNDAADIDYTEAVDVMTAVGMISGIGNGDFAPEAKIDRAGAAKLVAYLMLGKETADSIKPTENPFNDVDKNAWYAGYVAYCKSAKLIEGYNGNFDPNGTMTAYGFAKLLLGALGYDAKLETLTGDAWEVNTATLAIKNKLFAGNNGAQGNAAMTREEAALYAFNALKATTVYYANRGTEITLADGSTIIMGASPAEAVASDNDVKYNGVADDKTQLCESLYPTLKVSYSSVKDAFSRPAHTWSFGKPSKEVGTYADVAELSYEGAVKGGTIYADLGKVKVGTVTYYVDSKTAGTVPSGFAVASENDKTVGGNGAIVEVFTSVNATDDTKTDIQIAVINTYFGKVASVVSAKGDNAAYVTVAGMKFETEAFAKGDAVIYTKANGKIQSMELAETFTGKVTRIKDGKTFTIDGTQYELSDKKATVPAVDTTYDFYLDNQGYIIGADKVAGAAAKYAVLLDVKTGGWTTNTVEIKLLLADGEIITAEAKDNADIKSANFNKPFSYTVKDDVYTLTLADDAASSNTDANIKTGKSEISGTGATIYANNNTTFIVRTGTSDYTYTAYQGISKVPTMEKVNFVASVKDGVATLVYVYAGDVIGAESDLLYIAADSKETVETADGTVYSYNAVKDGAIDTVTVASDVKNGANNSALTVATGLYKNVVYDKDGVIVKMTPATEGASNDYIDATGTVADNNGMIVLGAKGLGYTSDAVVYSVDEDGEITALTIADLETDVNDTVKYTVNKAGLVTAIYLTPAEGNAAAEAPTSAPDTSAALLAKQDVEIAGANIAVNKAIKIDTASTDKILGATFAEWNFGDTATGVVVLEFTAPEGIKDTDTVTVTYPTTGTVSKAWSEFRDTDTSFFMVLGLKDTAAKTVKVQWGDVVTEYNVTLASSALTFPAI